VGVKAEQGRLRAKHQKMPYSSTHAHHMQGGLFRGCRDRAASCLQAARALATTCSKSPKTEQACGHCNSLLKRAISGIVPSECKPERRQLTPPSPLSLLPRPPPPPPPQPHETPALGARCLACKLQVPPPSRPSSFPLSSGRLEQSAQQERHTEDPPGHAAAARALPADVAAAVPASLAAPALAAPLP
jgi:hypothetical protein